MSRRDDFMQATAAGMLNMQEQIAALMQSDQLAGSAPGAGSFASFIGPMEVTSRVKSQLKALPQAGSSSPNAIWLVYRTTEQEREGMSSNCSVYQVTKEHGSNGLILPDSDGLGMSLAMCAKLDPTNDMASLPRLLLGTIAKAILKPGSMGMMDSMFGANGPASSAFDIRPSRPRKILFATQGELDMLEPDLKSIGITQMAVAERNLIRSMELYNSHINDAHYAANVDPTSGPEALGHAILAHGQTFGDPYVSEERVPFGSWSPPTERGDLPARWFSRPPEDPNSWRPTDLLGWRTNLERALLREDEAKVNAIVKKRNADDVREFVECRMLLTKCAQRGLITAMKLLIEKCNASVEGVQAPDAKSWWLAVQDSSGNCEGLTPLHQACRNGQVEAVNLLLDKGAEINRIDRSMVRASSLHHAVSGGQTECCRVLCERGANLTYEGVGGEALDISELVVNGDVFRERVQEKMRQILREYDQRCSHCRASNPPKSCPCKKERYCDSTCQKKRWKYHKKYHKEVVGNGSGTK